jgi:hypothetical protein
MIPCIIEAPWHVSAVSSDNQADASLGPVNANTFVMGNRGHGLRKWVIASSCGTYHTPHRDANGLCTLVTIKEGHKLWIWGARRSRSPLPTPLPKQGSKLDHGTGHCLMTASSMQLSWVQGTPCKTWMLLLALIDILKLSVFSIMPPGLPHAVFSVALEGYKPTCVVMSGSHFISEHTMPLMLEAAISHSAWHDTWTNATHDDIITHVDWMLHSLLIRSTNGIPSRIFQNSNVFALVIYARFAPWLRSLPHHRQLENPAWLKGFSPLDDLKIQMSQNAKHAGRSQANIEYSASSCTEGRCMHFLLPPHRLHSLSDDLGSFTPESRG